jgi:CRP/FNR family transcriptional regulator, cyclic AMP receptor protein
MGITSEDTIALLKRVPVFSALGEPELTRVAEVTVPRTFGAGQVVFHEGDASDTCYVVRSGHARAIREHATGRSITLATFGPGDIFGELAMFDSERRSATVESTEPTEVIAILGGDMRRLLREHSEIAVKLISALGRRLRETNERLARQSFQSVQRAPPNGTCSSPRRRPMWPSWPAPRASPPAAFSPSSSARE